MDQQSYIRVRWLHSSPDDPVELWSELNRNREEIRKVEIWEDGRVGFADEHREAGGTRLGEGAIPTLQEIAADPEFEADEVSSLEFENCWNTNVHQTRDDEVEG